MGYASPSHFAQVFRRELGVLPSAYRAGHRLTSMPARCSRAGNWRRGNREAPPGALGGRDHRSDCSRARRPKRLTPSSI
ncbi:hypothetical protein LPC04_04635 [Comamonadaceae bacterium BS-T2-15]|uniref:HTH araC/xylS-type domain-containing protein n=1 Tax=Scleromatobacter humisilvae TaxID=2897159 RepID=A0A9X2BZ66_9BURK|nr:hypothetical protein [Scleromatobacter humisilvae]